MIFRKLIGLGFLAMILFVFLGAFGTMRQSRTNMAYMQGYIAGQQAAASEDGAVNGNAATAPPMPPYSYNTHFRGHGGFFPGMGLFFCLLPLMFFGGMFLLFGLFGGRRHWHHGHGPCGSWQGGHKHGGYMKSGPKPPWVDDNDLADEPVMKA